MKQLDSVAERDVQAEEIEESSSRHLRPSVAHPYTMCAYGCPNERPHIGCQLMQRTPFREDTSSP